MRKYLNFKAIDFFFYTVCMAVLLSVFLHDVGNRNTQIQANRTSSQELYPYYGFLVVPSSVSRNNPNGSLGSDFSQVYYAAKAVRHGESPYTTKNPAFRDGSNRPPNYPPFTNWIYSSIANFSYPAALLIHSYGTMAVFLLTTILVLWRAGCVRYFGRLLFLYVLLYWYTTLGYAHFERGQFDLWTASCFALLFAYIYLPGRQAAIPIFAGLTAAVKWSSFPFLGTVSLVAMFGIDTRKRVGLFAVGVVVAATLVWFSTDVGHYFESLKVYEFNAPVIGISFGQIFPKIVAKSIQIVSALAVIIVFLLKTKVNNRQKIFRAASFPFLVAMAIQGMCYGTISYEYRVVSLLGLLAPLFIWLERERWVSNTMKYVTAIIFAIFLVVSFRVFYFYFFDYPAIHPLFMTSYYLFTSVLFLLISMAIMLSSKRG